LFTNCVFPPELDDQQILTYLDDPDAHPEIAHHLEQCPYCREKTNDLDQFQKRLTRGLYRATCPTPMELGEFHLRALAAPQRLVIAQHLRECPHCTQELSELERFLSDIAPQPSRIEPIKVLIARLVNGGAQVALRGEVSSSRVFMVDDTVITLGVQTSPDGEVSLHGSVGEIDVEKQKAWIGARVELKQTYLSPLFSYVDEYGGFFFTDLSPISTQVIIISTTGIAVQTEQVNLKV
jgi:hypothetical protein